MKRGKDVFTSDENMMLMLYFQKDRTGTIASLQSMSSQLTAEETELSSMTSTLIGKLKGISDADFLQLEPIQSVNS